MYKCFICNLQSLASGHQEQRMVTLAVHPVC